MNRGSLSFVIPIYNERVILADSIARLTAMARELTANYEIIVADDCSTDGSDRLADELAAQDSHLKVVHLSPNSKFGGALAAGIKAATRETIIYTDADIPVDGDDLEAALALLEEADIVTAYNERSDGDKWRRRVMSHVYNGLVQLLFRTNLRDHNAGFKVFRRQAVAELELLSRSPFIDVELFVRIKRAGGNIRQLPVIFKGRRKGMSFVARPAVIAKTFVDMWRFRLMGG